jgi:Fe-S-cluster containining protein
MTRSEQALLERAAPTSAALTWRDDPDPRFVRLAAAPCPFLTQTEGQAGCAVHPIRPLACRTFMCGRVDVAAEPFESEPASAALGLTGCGNLTARLQESERFRQHYRTHATQETRRWEAGH